MAAIDAKTFARDGYVVVRDPIGFPRFDDATAEINALVEVDADRSRAGMHSRDLRPGEAPASFAALQESALWPTLTGLVRPGELELVTPELQLVFHVPPTMIRPDTPHIDYHVPASERPDSFTLLVAILLSDQEDGEAGNVWVWPGTHLLYGEYLAAYGPTALLAHGGSIKRAAPGVILPPPVPVCGRAGDVFVAHPLLGHATGPNGGDYVRRAIYFRLRRTDHLAHWEECLVDPLAEYDVGDS